MNMETIYNWPGIEIIPLQNKILPPLGIIDLAYRN